MKDFEIHIKESSRELTKKEQVNLKTSLNFAKMDEIAPFQFTPVDYAVLSVHNENSKLNTDYDLFIFFADDGTIFSTASATFFRQFKTIWEDMKDEDDWGLNVFKRDSKNYAGKAFLTCNVI